MKVVLQAHGLPVLPYAVITSRGWEADRAACVETVDSLGYPVFVKPARGGSSLGISKVHDRDELDAAVEEARRHDPKVLVEAAAEGAREIECGVLQGFGANPPDTSVPAEVSIAGEHEFYDFAAKYLPEEQTVLTVPADLPDDVVRRVQELSARAFEVLSCEGLARVDFFVMPDERVVVNEINTMPGFTPSSMFPRMWRASGLEYPELVDRLIQLALHRDTGLR
jgi:D-alanine-D-alanine ligase